MFLSIIIVFFIINFDQHKSLMANTILKYFILILSFYLLLKFTITNFFYSSIYYKSINIYNKKINIKNCQFKFNKKIEFVSIFFLTQTIIINIIVSAILSYETSEIFEDKFIVAIVTTLSNLLLIPSFGSALNKIFTIKKNTNVNYKRLIRDQFLANLDLLKNYQIVNNFEFIKLKDLNLQSKRGHFWLTNYQEHEINYKLTKENNIIINEYKMIWEKYCQYLSFINNLQFSFYYKHLNLNIHLIFDAIIIDFLDV